MTQITKNLIVICDQGVCVPFEESSGDCPGQISNLHLSRYLFVVPQAEAKSKRILEMAVKVEIKGVSQMAALPKGTEPGLYVRVYDGGNNEFDTSLIDG